MSTPDDRLTEQALSALGDQCQIPADLEERIFAALGLPGTSAEPPSGVFPARGDATAKRALAALEEACEIPPDLADELLDKALRPAAPVVAIEPAFEPLQGVISRGRRESARTWWSFGIAAAAALLLTVLTAVTGPGPKEARAPVDVDATQVSEGDPLFEDLQSVMGALLREAARDCHLEVVSGVVWFERTGHVSVLDLSGKRQCEPDCVDRVAARFRLRPQGRAVLVQLSAVPQIGSHDKGAPAEGSGDRPVRVHLTAWWVNET